jgi:hypothetical protein
VPFLYFVAHPDGHHEFRKTYKEHLEAIKMVRAVARADSAARDKRQRDATDSTGKAAAAKDSARP